MVVARSKKKVGNPGYTRRGRNRTPRSVSSVSTPSGTKASLATVASVASGKQRMGLFDDFLPHLVARLAHLLNNDLVEKLRREGINVARWRILAVLAMGDGITISEIIDRAMMEQSALSRVLMTMEEEGYVRRVPRREDARCVEVFLTERGRALFHALDPVVRRRQGRLLKDFTQQEVDAAFTLLRRMVHNLSE